jgi:hypothetical protein
MKKAGLSSILIAVVLLALGVTAEAQQAKIPPIGYLSSFDPASDCDGTEAIRLALRELGYIEGQLDALRLVILVSLGSFMDVLHNQPGVWNRGSKL